MLVRKKDSLTDNLQIGTKNAYSNEHEKGYFTLNKKCPDTGESPLLKDKITIAQQTVTLRRHRLCERCGHVFCFFTEQKAKSLHQRTK